MRATNLALCVSLFAACHGEGLSRDPAPTPTQVAPVPLQDSICADPWDSGACEGKRVLEVSEALPIAERLRLAVTPARAVVAWNMLHNADSRSLRVAHVGRDGVGRDEELTEGDLTQVGQYFDLAVRSEGLVDIAYSIHAMESGMARRTIDTATGHMGAVEEVPWDDSPGPVSMAATSDGKLYVSLFSRQKFSHNVLVRGKDGAWSTSMTLGGSFDLRTPDTGRSAIDVDGADRVHVAGVRTISSNRAHVRYSHLDADGWKPTRTVDDPRADHHSAYGVDLAACPGGRRAVAFFVLMDDAVQLRLATWARLEVPKAMVLRETRADVKPEQLALAVDCDASDRVHLAVTMPGEDGRPVEYWREDTATGEWRIDTVTKGLSSTHRGLIDLSLDARGAPHIAYRDVATGAIMYAGPSRF